VQQFVVRHRESHDKYLDGYGCESAAGLRVDLPQSPTMLDLDGQRRKRPGNRERIDRIKDEMDRDVLRNRIAAIIYDALDYDDEDVTLSQHLSEVLYQKLGLGLETRLTEDFDGNIYRQVRWSTFWQRDEQ
jgi:hypothetical protein